MSYHNTGSLSSSRSSTPPPAQQAAPLNIINSLIVNTAAMPVAETIRSFKINGSIGAEFVIHVTKENTIEYYDFTLKSFSAGHNSGSNNLVVTLSTRTYSGNIVFPSGGGTYTISLIPSPGTKLVDDSKVFSSSITKQTSNSTVTFKGSSANTSSYATFPTSTSIGALNDVDKFDFDWDVTNVSTDANGFGLIPISNWKDLNSIKNPWFFTTTETVDGAVSPSDLGLGLVVVVDDVTDIGIGSYISAVGSGSLSGNPVVSSVNSDTKEVTISIAQTFADGVALTFRADGVNNIKNATGISMEGSFELTDPEIFNTTNLVTKTIRAGSSGTTINLNGTYGVGHNDTYTNISGVGITSASVVSVSASSGSGSIVVSVSQGTLTTNTPIYFSGTTQVFNVRGTMKISSYPTANKTIYLDVDKFLNPATVS